MFERLRQIPLFKGFSDADLAIMAETVAEQRLEAGELLFRKGDEGHTCCVIISGALEVIASLAGEEIQLEVRHAGQIIGEMALIDRSPRSATVRAVSASVLAVLDEQHFATLMRSDPGLAMGMLRDGTARLRTTNQRMISDLEAKNVQLTRAYQDLQAAQAELIRLSRIEEELAVARRIQASFLPQALPQPPRWQIAAFSRSTQAVGGDFYDCIELPGDQIGLVVADVCGKGVTAALFVALTRSLLRAASLAPTALRTDHSAHTDNPLIKALWLTNDYITREHSSSNMFITLFYGLLHPQTGTLSYVNAGHNPPLLISADGQHITECEVGGLPLGIMEQQAFVPTTAHIAAGEMLVGFSDGITEAMNSAGEPYGDERLQDVLRSHVGVGAQQLVETIVETVDAYAAGAPQADDMTLLIVQRSA